MSRISLLAACALCGTAAAQPAPTPIATYAIVVGSNAGGPGQTELRYAEDDARSVGALLVELGGYTAQQVDVVVHPTPDQLRDRLARLGERVTADLAAGRQSRVFFYYSGHARAQAIDLGDAELPLSELRQRLFQVPATLTIVVLDACQSGAFSRIKGAEPAADFSFSSREHLDAAGVAVLASSSGSELSQESEQLHSSYFTHNLLVGLRGAGDENGDGEVSIDEAYRYAYHQTLLATAETAVGGQHVTFEADLKGHGEVALSFPRAATAAIVLPPQLEGQTLVEDKRAHAVIAETYKARGAAVRIAVAPGEYEVIVRSGATLSRCEVDASGAVELDHCRSEPIVASTTKGGAWLSPNRISVGLIVGPERQDGYTANLQAFGYVEQGLAPASAGISIAWLRRIDRRIWVGAAGSYVGMPSWKETVTGENASQKLAWSTAALAAVARGEQPFAASGIASRFAAYAQIAAGLGIGRTVLTNAQAMTYDDNYLGPAFSAGAGLRVQGPHLHPLGLEAGYEFDYAPVIKDLIGDTHASGGHRVTLSLTYSF
ncbi:MAG TPA: caspase family protein [Kofleriaceae bacterium]|nr:caspase family protein [Kofleriaceae bacterium]